jgi:hypothetical protein
LSFENPDGVVFRCAFLEQLRPLQNAAFCPISVSGSNFIPQNTQCIPAVKIFAFLELEQKSAFFKGLQFSRC